MDRRDTSVTVNSRDYFYAMMDSCLARPDALGSFATIHLAATDGIRARRLAAGCATSTWH